MEPFIIIDHQSDDPCFNLAAEEYLLHEFNQNVVFLYVNKPTVVVGKHQNAFDECQIDFCHNNDIQIIRRLSGGGTVFHGPGNLNFCFIKNGKDATKLIDFKKHLTPVNAFLHELGIPSEFSGRNDLLVDGFKVSGNAEHVYSKRKRIIHHGTLLYNADLTSLNQSIAPKNHMTFETHAVKSVRSNVKNLHTFLDQPIDFKRFNEDMFDFMKQHYSCEVYSFSKTDLVAIDQIMTSKYATWEWNFGYSPKFSVSIKTNDNQSIKLNIIKGIVDSIVSNDSEIESIHTCIGKPFIRSTFEALGLKIAF